MQKKVNSLKSTIEKLQEENKNLQLTNVNNEKRIVVVEQENAKMKKIIDYMNIVPQIEQEKDDEREEGEHVTDKTSYDDKTGLMTMIQKVMKTLMTRSLIKMMIMIMIVTMVIKVTKMVRQVVEMVEMMKKTN